MVRCTPEGKPYHRSGDIAYTSTPTQLSSHTSSQRPPAQCEINLRDLSTSGTSWHHHLQVIRVQTMPVKCSSLRPSVGIPRMSRVRSKSFKALTFLGSSLRSRLSASTIHDNLQASLSVRTQTCSPGTFGTNQTQRCCTYLTCEGCLSSCQAPPWRR